MNLFERKINRTGIKYHECLRRTELKVLQVNLGNLCNQSCRHCHVDASPNGKNIMSKNTIDDVLSFIKENKIETLDITGGAPEMNPSLKYLVENAGYFVKEVLVRSNLTILSNPFYSGFIDFYKDNEVHLVCSLPCYSKANVNQQRGDKVYFKSIDALKKLNKIGYGSEANLKLDLVYNPSGPFLPPEQTELEKDYKLKLMDGYGILFNNLITIANVPIKRFAEDLKQSDCFEEYCQLLYENFNPEVMQNIMCRTFLSVAYDGALYDCDFNQAMGMAMLGHDRKKINIKDLKLSDLINKKTLTATHCLACTAGNGSSCKGSLK